MVAEPSEEDSTSQGRDLKGLDVHVDAVFVPCILPYGIGDNACEKSIEVEEEKDGNENSQP